jgi:DNA replication licensing factor MCM4
MSSPEKRRTTRSSASTTPRRSGRNPRSSALPSSPGPAGPDDQLQAEASQASQRGPQATPRNSRLQDSNTTESPLFFRSSPANGSATGAGADEMDEDDGGATPKASAMNIGGILHTIFNIKHQTNTDRLFPHPLRLQLQPRTRRPLCSKHRHPKQQ